MAALQSELPAGARPNSAERRGSPDTDFSGLPEPFVRIFMNILPTVIAIDRFNSGFWISEENLNIIFKFGSFLWG
jgi:hypothetical protein